MDPLGGQERNDGGDEKSRKRFRCWNEWISESDTSGDTEEEKPVSAASFAALWRQTERQSLKAAVSNQKQHKIKSTSK